MTSGANGDRFGLSVPESLVEEVAKQVATLIVERLPERPERYLRIEEAAEYLACPVSRVRDLKDQGRLKHYRDGRRLIFRREDLDAVLTVREPEGR